MSQYIDKSALVSEIEKRIKNLYPKGGQGMVVTKILKDHYEDLLSFIDTLEVKDPYITCIQYGNKELAIKAHAEDYSFNIESELFNQLTKEQQALWRKEIEQACISGGYSGLNLAKDPRYKENLEVKEVDLEKEMDLVEDKYYGFESLSRADVIEIIKHFFEFGIKAQKGEEV